MMSEILIRLLAWKGRSGVEWDEPRIKYYNVYIYQFVTHNGKYISAFITVIRTIFYLRIVYHVKGISMQTKAGKERRTFYHRPKPFGIYLRSVNFELESGLSRFLF